jgi:predicted DNA-binding protein (MmcQ/YjbR family)
MRDARRLHRRILSFALGLPGAYEDHPWGEVVAKVNKKVFVFLGSEEHRDTHGMTVKLDESLEQALASPGATPAGYGLGKSGRVSIRFAADTPPARVLEDWVEESYRRVAPKRLVAELDAQRAH